MLLDEEWLNETQNMTLEEYLELARGPKHLPLKIVVPITVIYCTIFLTGVLGNLAVCLVIATNSCLHTATNYYLFSLAVSDVTLLLLGLPNDLSVFWQQYPWVLGEGLCKLRALVSEMTSYTSVLTIVAFTMERYLAICHPLHSYTMSGLRRAVRIIAVLWVVSFVCALPFAVFTKVNYITYPPNSDIVVEESAFCAMFEENVPKYFPICELSFLVFFLVPLIVITVLYVKIGLTVRASSLGASVDGAVHGETKKSQARKSIIRMLAAVVIMFFLCWAPFHAQRLVYMYGRDLQYFLVINEWLYLTATCLYYFSATVNPILYNIMSINYRKAFLATICRRGRRHEYHSSVKGSFVEGRRQQRSLTWRNQHSIRTLPHPATDTISSPMHDRSEQCSLSSGYPSTTTPIHYVRPVSTNTYGGQMSSATSPSTTRDLVVRITPDRSYTTVTTETRLWPQTTTLRVTMNQDLPETRLRCRDSLDYPTTKTNKVCVQMETCI